VPEDLVRGKDERCFVHPLAESLVGGNAQPIDAFGQLDGKVQFGPAGLSLGHHLSGASYLESVRNLRLAFLEGARLEAGLDQQGMDTRERVFQ